MEEFETQATALTLLNGLRPRAFKDSLSKQPAKTMDEIQLRAKRYIYLEETQKATTNSTKRFATRRPLEEGISNTEGQKASRLYSPQCVPSRFIQGSRTGGTISEAKSAPSKG